MSSTCKVLLIGGTSHVGKSTLAQKIAEQLAWSYQSTDQLARHPGRPWRKDAQPLPDHVTEYYVTHPTAALLDSVVDHYRFNVWPIAAAMVRSRIQNPYDPCLVLEGSALLPGAFHGEAFEQVAGVWLTATEEAIRDRIRIGSRFAERSIEAQRLIQAFADRSVAFDRVVTNACEKLGLRCVDADDAEQWVTHLVSELSSE